VILDALASIGAIVRSTAGQWRRLEANADYPLRTKEALTPYREKCGSEKRRTELVRAGETIILDSRIDDGGDRTASEET